MTGLPTCGRNTRSPMLNTQRSILNDQLKGRSMPRCVAPQAGGQDRRSFDLLLPKGAQWVAGGFSRRTPAPEVGKSRRDGRDVRRVVSRGLLPSLRDWAVCAPRSGG